MLATTQFYVLHFYMLIKFTVNKTGFVPKKKPHKLKMQLLTQF